MSSMDFLEKLMQGRRPLSVSELTAHIKILVEDQFFDVWVEGEISNFRRHSSGHWYFTLKDEGALLRCASFRMQNRLMRFTPEDGLTVSARGRLSVYEARGEYQMVVEYMEPVGFGALQFAFEQLKRRLAAEGLFDLDRKRPLPLLPRSVGVVTSPTGAAVRDIVRVIKRRNSAVNILIAPARVQGDGAAREVAKAIEMLNQQEEVDVIIVGRGGGSVEDLSCFNEEAVARAIYNSRAPVISAVGHETDFTIADFVADMRASTPSAAAEMVAAAGEEIRANIRGLTEAMVAALRYRILEWRNQLSEVQSSRAFAGEPRRIRALSQRVDEATYAIETAARKAVRAGRAAWEPVDGRLRAADIRRAMVERRGRLAVLSSRLAAGGRAAVSQQGSKLSLAAGKLESLSPLSVLARGYAIAFDEKGRVIKRAGDIAKGDRVRVRVAEGEMTLIRE
ncbi:MAG TPA: exodeoxyribonuclease VII large subunit [Blastocatellia bacterium]|nr:exodeoxyribonuclease VII large subunit [Blastocatellia bacterium]